MTLGYPYGVDTISFSTPLSSNGDLPPATSVDALSIKEDFSALGRFFKVPSTSGSKTSKGWARVHSHLDPWAIARLISWFWFWLLSVLACSSPVPKVAWLHCSEHPFSLPHVNFSASTEAHPSGQCLLIWLSSPMGYAWAWAQWPWGPCGVSRECLNSWKALN